MVVGVLGGLEVRVGGIGVISGGWVKAYNVPMWGGLVLCDS